jgi:hypothetical protein
MFVAALGQNQNGVSKNHRPERVIDVSVGSAMANSDVRAKTRAKPLPGTVLPQLMTAAISSGL